MEVDEAGEEVRMSRSETSRYAVVCRHRILAQTGAATSNQLFNGPIWTVVCCSSLERALEEDKVREKQLPEAAVTMDDGAVRVLPGRTLRCQGEPPSRRLPGGKAHDAPGCLAAAADQCETESSTQQHSILKTRHAALKVAPLCP